MKKIAVTSSFVALALFSVSAANAALTVEAATPEALVTQLVGSNDNISVVPESTQYIGTSTQAGIYSGAGEGILLTTGNALTRAHSVTTGTGSNAQLSVLAGGGSTYDQNVLTFSFTNSDPSKTAIETSFIFASYEYPNYTYPTSQFRDTFGFFVDGVNYAHFPDGSPVIVQEGEFTYGSDVGYYDGSSGGMTGEFSLIGLLDPTLSVHTLTIAIADVGDSAFDSGIFLGSFSSFTCVGANCNVGVTPTPGIPEPETYAMLLAGLGLMGLAAKRRRKSA
jgi:hypothetical protein